MHVFDAGLKQCLFCSLKDLDLYILFCPFDNFLYTGRMDASVNDESLKRKSCHFPAHRVKTAQCDGLGGIVNYQVHARKGLKGPDVAALSADDAALHLVGRKIYNADHCVRRKFNTAALDCGCNNFLSFAICFTLCTFFQFFKPETYQMIRFGLDFGQQEVSGLFACKLCCLFEIGDQFLFLCGELVEFFLHLFMFLDQFFFFSADAFDLPVKIFFFLFETSLGTLQFVSALLGVPVELLP